MSKTLSQIATALESDKSAIRQAILSGGGTCPEEHGFDSFASDIGTIPASSPSYPSEYDDVVFYDYDGTVVYSYTKEEFLSLTSLPSNPSHTGMTALGWNATFNKMKEIVNLCGVGDFGQLYKSSDNKTKIYIDINEQTKGYQFYIYFTQSDGSTTIDWGDGTTPDAFTSSSYTTAYHTYTNSGKYVISIEKSSTGTLTLGSNNSSYAFISSYNYDSYGFRNAVIGFVIGNPSRFNIGEGCFNSCTYLETACLGTKTIYNYCFSGCISLKHINLTGSQTSLNGDFYGCSSLRCISAPNMQVSYKGGLFAEMYGLNRIVMPYLYTYESSGSVSYPPNAKYICCVRVRGSGAGLPFWGNIDRAILICNYGGTLYGGSGYSCRELHLVVTTNNLSIDFSSDTNYRELFIEGTGSISSISCGSWSISKFISKIPISTFAQSCFSSSYINELELQNTAMTFSDYCFQSNRLTKLIINGNVSSIGKNALGCTYIKYMEFKGTIGTIDSNAFGSGNNFSRVTFKFSDTNPAATTHSSYVFGNAKYCTFLVPSGTSAAYQQLFRGMSQNYNKIIEY